MTHAIRQWFPTSVSALGVLVAGLIFLPLLYIISLALSTQAAVWSRLWQTRIPELLSNTAWLALGVSIGTLLIGVSLAWLVVRYDFWGRRMWEWALVLPLTMPTYVLAYVYTYLLGTGGPVEQIWRLIAGPQAQVFSPQTYAGATLVMTLDTFPFVYLLTRAALLNLNVSFEEVGRACGVSRLGILWRVTLPLLRPAIVAGLSLVILYVVSDFGAVSLLRYQTFTYAVYQQLTGRYDHAAAAILSLLLVLFALIFLLAERWFRQRSRFYQTTGRYRAPARKTCGPIGAMLITGYFASILGAAFAVPAWLLIKWTAAVVIEGAIDARFLGFIWNSTGLFGDAALFPGQRAVPAGSLCRVCVARPGRRTCDPRCLLTYRALLVWHRHRADGGLCRPFSSGRTPDHGTGSATSHAESGRSGEKPRVGHRADTQNRHASACSWWIHRGLGADLSAVHERIAGHAAVASSGFRYLGGSCLVRSQ
jgi:iron(III) transport system permease protein